MDHISDVSGVVKLVRRKYCGKSHDEFMPPYFLFLFGDYVAYEIVIYPEVAAGVRLLVFSLSCQSQTHNEREREWRKMEFLSFPLKSGNSSLFLGATTQDWSDGRKKGTGIAPFLFSSYLGALLS